MNIIDQQIVERRHVLLLQVWSGPVIVQIQIKEVVFIGLILVTIEALSNSMAYGTRRFNAAFTRTLQ